MSFPILTKLELIEALNQAGVRSRFFDKNAMDAVATCHYFTVRDEVVAGHYPFSAFIEAHTKLEQAGKPYTIGEVRLYAQSLFHTRANQLRVMTEEQISDGLVI